jgi:hypothetical protein
MQCFWDQMRLMKSNILTEHYKSFHTSCMQQIRFRFPEKWLHSHYSICIIGWEIKAWITPTILTVTMFKVSLKEEKIYINIYYTSVVEVTSYGWTTDFRVKNFHFSTSSRRAPGPTKPPIQRVPAPLSPEVKWPGCEADHLPPTSAKIKKTCIYTSTPPYVFMA